MTPSPRTTFLLDSVGGLLTAVMLCLVLPSFQPAVGMPREALVTLGAFGVVYGSYSACCFLFVKTRWRRALAVIIFANALYCVVSVLAVWAHRDIITSLGVAYFVVELCVMAAVIALEMSVFVRLAAGAEAEGRYR